MPNLTRREIVTEIHGRSGIAHRQVADTLQMALNIVMKALSEGRSAELRNFGVLEVQRRKARVGRNPNRPAEEVVIPARAVAKFKSGKSLRGLLAKIDTSNL